MKVDTIGVVDFGGQYAHLIATKIRRLSVYSEIRQPDDPTEMFSRYKGIIISGSPALSSRGEESGYNKKIYDLDLPILGICFGHQEIAKHYGGKVISGGREWGETKFKIIRNEHPLFEGLSDVESVFMSHYDSVVEIGEGFEEFGVSFLNERGEVHRYAAIGSDKYKRYGFQFHPEVDDTVNGDKMIANFVLNICGCKQEWTMKRYLANQFERIRSRVGDGSVFLLVSGGVDSTVTAVLLKEILGRERVRLLHIDNGLMRKDESKNVIEAFKRLGLDRDLHFVDASKRFLSALKGLFEPEKKRRVIGDTFIEVFYEEAKRLNIENYFFGQGTIYPDTIETGGTQRADVIKTHHNRVPIIQKMINEGRVVEPLAELYKVEVREIGKELGISDDLLMRHPFPGPGLGVRVLCSDEREEDLSHISWDVSNFLRAYNITGMVLPIRSVGVKADLRSYEHPVIINAEYSESLFKIASEMLTKINGINRCVVNLSNSDVVSAKNRRDCVTEDRLSLLRELDYIVNSKMIEYNYYHKIWQCPVVLVPLIINNKGEEMIVIRPVSSERGMTAKAAFIPNKILDEIVQEILRFDKVSTVAIDITSKPPATIEWE